MTNPEILESLSLIAKRLNSDRIVTRYTSNEGAVAAHNALHCLGEFKVNDNDHLISKALSDCKNELNRAIQLNEIYVKRHRDSFGDPSAAPIATQHAIERFILNVRDNMI